MNAEILDNNGMLEAWNEWKTVCSIHGCSNEHSDMLKRIVTSAFRKKVIRIVGLDNLRSFMPRDCATEFDIGIIEKAECPGISKRTGTQKTRKNYKDYAWSAIAASEDPHLKVINGILIGPQGIINDIVIKYLMNEHGFTSHYDFGKRSLEHMVSIHEPIEGKDGKKKEFEEFIDSALTPTPIEMKEMDSDLIARRIPEIFTPEKAAVLLAKSYNLPLDNRTLLSFLRVEKTQAYVIWKEAKNDLMHFLKDNFAHENVEYNELVTKEILNCFFHMLSAEIRADEFLLLLNSKNNSAI